MRAMLQRDSAQNQTKYHAVADPNSILRGESGGVNKREGVGGGRWGAEMFDPIERCLVILFVLYIFFFSCVAT